MLDVGVFEFEATIRLRLLYEASSLDYCSLVNWEVLVCCFLCSLHTIALRPLVI